MDDFGQTERLIADAILPQLYLGRSRFDHDHTVAVVYWIKWLIKKISLGQIYKRILITAAYAHDWGYAGLFREKEGESLDKITQKKALHMRRGARKIGHFLRTRCSSYFTADQIRRIVHLVAVHDNIEALATEDEIILMEADTLGMLDSARVKPTFSYADNEKFMKEQFYGRRLLHFRHQCAKQAALKLVEQRQRFYLSD
ncbi:hypothetical protein M1523_01005 [Patescibacteria group bacterium]|nr:hypothetical protein [Patescibacteria group bacterium]MCL5091736.1 hypothetical protein [Patescibacteria group bacterium]